MLTVWLMLYQLLQLSESALYLWSIIFVVHHRGISPPWKVPANDWNKGLPDYKLASTFGNFMLIHKEQYITKYLIPLAISCFRLLYIIIQLNRFKITCLTDFFYNKCNYFNKQTILISSINIQKI